MWKTKYGICTNQRTVNTPELPETMIPDHHTCHIPLQIGKPCISLGVNWYILCITLPLVPCSLFHVNQVRANNKDVYSDMFKHNNGHKIYVSTTHTKSESCSTELISFSVFLQLLKMEGIYLHCPILLLKLETNCEISCQGYCTYKKIYTRHIHARKSSTD